MKIIRVLLAAALCLFVFTCKQSDNSIKVSSVAINEADFSIRVERERTLSVTILPDDADNKNIQWESDDTSVAEIDQNGLLKAVATGTANITASATDGSGESGSITVTVTETLLVETITINDGDFTLVAGGDSKTLITTVLPQDAVNKNLNWESDNTAVATTTTLGASMGYVKSVSPGTANIKAIARDGSGISASVVLTVSPRPVDDIIINGGDFALGMGKTATLTVLALPANASDKSVKWESSDPSIASVGELSGEVTGLAIGTAEIKATALDGSGKFGTVQVSVIEMVSSISINEGNFSLGVGENKQLSVTVLPDDAGIKELSWASSNNGIATVNQSGLVTAGFTPGSASIIVTAKDGSGESGSVTVTVSGGSIMSPAEIFNALKGTQATTNGWADMANSGQGLKYASPANFILIDDALYPDSLGKRTAFTTAINNNNDKFIIISGDIDLSDGKINDNDKSYFDEFRGTAPYARVHEDISFNLLSNTTIIGINNARFMFGGLVIRNGSQNIIIRNVTFYDAHGSTANDTTKPGQSESKASATALQIENDPGGSGIWVDHCKFTDGTCTDMIRNYNHDGAFDIKHGRFITVSWTEFSNHDKVMLVGNGDTAVLANPLNRQITLHHNYFHGATQRMPRTRGTQMHVYNNYYSYIGVNGNNGYCMGPGWGAHFIVENNYFDSGTFYSSSTKIVDWYDSAAHPALVWSAGNNTAGGAIPRSANDKTDGSKPWIPGYDYSLEPNESLPMAIPAGAGPVLVFRK